ncbi:MAG TPA: acetoin utilization AcuB family protein [Candidatus Avamphibacillus sp.]|nr:acetoin utilization AcuB family protein [Candidatus Avamphibacillus sp.]
MLVEQIMKTEVVTLPPTATIAEALQLLQKHRIRHIPIVNKNNNVIGIVSDRDVRDASPSIFETDSEKLELQYEINTIMSQPVVTIHPLDFVEEIAKIFYDKEFASLPVVQNNQLVGMVTEKDMLHTLIQLTGTHVQSSHLEIKVPHRSGILPEVTAIFGRRKVNIVSVLIYPYDDDPQYKVLVFRIQTINPTPVIEDLKKAGFELLWPQHITELKS